MERVYSVCPKLWHCQRCRELQVLIDRYKGLWPQTNGLPPQLTIPQQNWFFEWLRKRARDETSKGYALPKKGRGASPFWWFAFAALWRFGLGVHVVRLDTLKSGQRQTLLPSQATLREWQGRPLIFFLENVGGLWEETRKIAFEEVIRWCSLASVPLWIELSDGFDGSKASSAKGRESGLLRQRSAGSDMFDRRIAQAKQQMPLVWLAEDSRSRLGEICQLPRDMLE